MEVEKTEKSKSAVSITHIVGGIRVVETEYRVNKPVFEDFKVDRPVYVDKKIEIPVGMQDALERLATMVTDKVLAKLDEKLADAITKRVSDIEVPKIVYKVVEELVQVERPTYKDVEVIRPTFIDKEIINPVLVDKEITNAVVKDVEVERPVFKDRVVIQPIFEDVKIDKPVFVDKEIVVIHPKYVDMKGIPE